MTKKDLERAAWLYDNHECPTENCPIAKCRRGRCVIRIAKILKKTAKPRPISRRDDEI